MDNTQTEFENWLALCHDWLQHVIGADPARFKVRSRPTFNNFPVVPSKDPTIYPPEFRTKLAITRTGSDINDVDVAAVLECNGQKVDPSQVWSGSYITPIFRLNYYKDGDDYGLNFTVLKGKYEPSVVPQISNDAWIIDSNTSGSGSGSGSGSTSEDVMA